MWGLCLPGPSYGRDFRWCLANEPLANTDAIRHESILMFIGMNAVICAIDSGLFSETGYASFSNIPPLFFPDLSVLGAGIIFVPFFTSPVFVAMSVVAYRSPPRSCTITLFFWCPIRGVVIGISLWGSGMRFVSWSQSLHSRAFSKLLVASFRKGRFGRNQRPSCVDRMVRSCHLRMRVSIRIRQIRKLALDD